MGVYQVEFFLIATLLLSIVIKFMATVIVGSDLFWVSDFAEEAILDHDVPCGRLLHQVDTLAHDIKARHRGARNSSSLRDLKKESFRGH